MSKRRRRVAALLDLNRYYTRSVFAGMRQYFRHHTDWVCENLNPVKDPDWKWLLQGKWDGAILYGNAELSEFLRHHKIPVVNVSNSLPHGYTCARVVNDDRAVGRIAADHFLERGLRHFAYFGLKDKTVSVERRAGFESRVKEAGYQCEQFPLNFEMNRWRVMHTTIPGLKERIAEGLLPIGMFCMNDEYAAFIIDYCSAHRIRMPEQVAVVGADNSEIADGLADIPFSSVKLQTTKIGYTAMEILANMLSGKKPPKSPILIPPNGIAVRASSELMAVDDPLVTRALGYLRERAYKRVLIDDIVRLAGVSRRMLEKRFKEALKRTLYEEVLRLRIERAKSLLMDTDLAIYEVAESSGFGQTKQLHAIFTRETQLTPSQYRKKFQVPR